jgi:hypothetical protein
MSRDFWGFLVFFYLIPHPTRNHAAGVVVSHTLSRPIHLRMHGRIPGRSSLSPVESRHKKFRVSDSPLWRRHTSSVGILVTCMHMQPCSVQSLCLPSAISAQSQDGTQRTGDPLRLQT